MTLMLRDEEHGDEAATAGPIETRALIDVAVVGGGPAGLALAIEAARRGASVAVFERRAFPIDKACGEGILPPGVRALARLGVLDRLDPGACAPLAGVRYIEPDGSSLEAAFPAPGGIGVRRTALVGALADRARELGARLYPRCPVHGHAQADGRVLLETGRGKVAARWLVAADGLHSPIRHREGLSLDHAPNGARSQNPLREHPAELRRFGARLHFCAAPWTDRVEVHLSAGMEAYATPAGPGRVGVALLWGVRPGLAALPPALLHGASAGERVEACRRLLESRFPALAARLRDAPADSTLRGAGPFFQRARRRVRGRVVLLGDAAGYVDAITGEGISLALEGARALAAALERALARPREERGALARFERDTRPALRRYELGARALVILAERPRLRAYVLAWMRRHPKLFASTVRWMVDAPSIEPVRP